MPASQCCTAASRARIIYGHRRIRRRACRAGRQRLIAVDAAVLVLRDEPCGAQSVAGVGRRHAVVFQESAQSAVLHHLRKIGRRGLRAVRALDAPLRPAGMADLVDAGRRRARAGAYLDRVGTAVLPAPSFRARIRAPAAPAAAAAADRRADVGPLRDAAARHRRGVSAQSRRLHHRLESMRAWCRCRRAASISTITSTT